MTIQEALPGFFSDCKIKEISVWSQEWNASDAEQLDSLANLLKADLFYTGRPPEEYIQAGEVFLSDLQALKTVEQDARVLDFLQYLVAKSIAFHLIHNKLFPYVYDWLAHSLSERIDRGAQRTMEADRIREFISSHHPFIKESIDDAVVAWVYILFYYARATSGHNPMAQGFCDTYLNWYLRLPEKGTAGLQYLYSLCQLQSWCNKYGKTVISDRVTQLLEMFFKDPALPGDGRKQLIMHFSCGAAEVLGLKPDQWAETLLNEFGQQLRGHEPMQAWVNYTKDHTDRIIDNLEAIRAAIRSYTDQIRNGAADLTLASYELSQSYTMLAPAINTLLAEGRAAEANSLFGIYFGIANAQVEALNILHLIPNHPLGIIWTHNAGVHIQPAEDMATSMQQIIEIANVFLGQTTMINEIIDYEPEVPKRLGVPSEREAPKMERLLRAHFRFSEVQHLLQQGGMDGYFLHFGNNLPLQPVMVADTGATLPMALSFQKPKTERPIRKVLLWKDVTTLAAVELEGLTSIFRKASVEVTEMNGDTHSLSDFRRCYESDDFDCIWIAGHGIYELFEPHKSRIPMHSEIELSPEHLADFSRGWNDRRLFFLNICDGAATSLQNSPVAIGISNHLVHAGQSVLGHLWPVNPRLAMALGWTFATFLTSGRSYLESYSETVLLLRAGKDAVVDHLNQYLDKQELIDRVSNIEFDFTNFIHWGSLAYLN